MNLPCTIQNLISIQFTEIELLIVELILRNDSRWFRNQRSLNERQQVDGKWCTTGWNQSKSTCNFININESFAQSFFGEDSTFPGCFRKCIDDNRHELITLGRRSNSFDFILKRTKLQTPRFSRLTFTNWRPESLTCSPQRLCLVGAFLSISSLCEYLIKSNKVSLVIKR